MVVLLDGDLAYDKLVFDEQRHSAHRPDGDLAYDKIVLDEQRHSAHRPDGDLAYNTPILDEQNHVVIIVRREEQSK